jgi:hypothetical protein
MTGKLPDTQGPDEYLLGLIRAAGLEKTFAEFPADVLAAIRGATQERDKLPAPRVDNK